MAIKPLKVSREFATRQKSAKESELLLSIMASGIKIRGAVATLLGVTEGEFVSPAFDDEAGKIYIAKATEETEGKHVVSDKGVFSSTALKKVFLKAAGITDLGNKGCIDVAVSATPTVDGGISYYELTFKEYTEKAEKAEDDTSVAETTSPNAPEVEISEVEGSIEDSLEDDDL